MQRRRYVGRITRRTQVTVPMDVVRELGLSVPGKVIFEVDDRGVHLRREAYTLSELAGVLGPLAGLDAEQMVRIANREAEDELVSEYREVPGR